MIVVPVPFSTEGAKMLQHTKMIMDEQDDDGSSLIAIHPSFDKLPTTLRIAVANEYSWISHKPHTMICYTYLDYHYSFTNRQNNIDVMNKKCLQLYK